MTNTKPTIQEESRPEEVRARSTSSNHATSTNAIEAQAATHMTQTSQSQDSEERMDDDRPPDRVLNIKVFLTSLHDRPVFTRQLLHNIAARLQSTQASEDVEMRDYYSKKHTVDSSELIAHSKTPGLIYNSYHVMADEEPYSILRFLEPELKDSIVRGFGDDVEEMIKYSKFPVYIHLRDNGMAEDYDLDLVQNHLTYGMMFWNKGVEGKMINECLRDMASKQIIQITNIVCIGHGSLGRGEASMLQHVAASYIAKELIALYEGLGKPLEDPIDIVAQDPSYTENNKYLLSLLPCPIRIVTDPEGFLAINENSLVMSSYPTIPVKQIVADLAADSSSGKGPAAVLWNNALWDEKHGGFDIVTYPWKDVIYFANPGSRRLLDMLEGYTKMMDGAEMFSDRFIVEEVATSDDAVETCNSDEEIDGLDDSIAGLSFEDTSEHIRHQESESDKEDLSESSDTDTTVEARDKGENEETDTADVDITKGVGGFEWLEGMELWARLD